MLFYRMAKKDEDLLPHPLYFWYALPTTTTWMSKGHEGKKSKSKKLYTSLLFLIPPITKS